MTVISGDTGIDKVQDASIVDADLNLSVKPMFSAYSTVAQSVPASTLTKLAFHSKEFDATNAFNTTTYRFAPQKAGYYNVIILQGIETGTGANSLRLYKNGAFFRYFLYDPTSSTGGTVYNRSAIVYLNGTTDYIECYIGCSVGQNTLAGLIHSNFQAHYIGA